MKVLVFVKATPNSEKGIFPPDDAQSCSRTWASSTRNSSRPASCRRPMASSPAARASASQFSDSGTWSVIDGPFVETKELVAGYWIWNVKSLDEAVEWAKRCPNPMPGEEGVLEIRPCYAMEEFEALCRKTKSSEKRGCARRSQARRSRKPRRRLRPGRRFRRSARRRARDQRSKVSKSLTFQLERPCLMNLTELSSSFTIRIPPS